MRIPVLITGLLLATACGGGESAALPSQPDAQLRVGDVQGSSAASPYNGVEVAISGVVTGDFQYEDSDAHSNLGGFYVLGEPDGDPESSDGIFVFDGSNPASAVNVGDVVEVRGTVKEYFGETQIEAASIRVTGSAAIKAHPVSSPARATVENEDGDLLADLERYEGMLVEFSDTLTVTNLRNLGRFGEVTLSEGGRLFRFTNSNRPDTAAYRAHQDLNVRRSIVLDDGLRDQNPRSVRYLTAGSSAGYTIRLGDTLSGLTGNLRYSRGAGSNGDETWRLVPTLQPEFVSRNPRPGAPSLGGSLRVGAFNVLNFFTTLDTEGGRCGPGGDPCRGADSSAEYDRQLTKLATALLVSGADIFGLTELENNASASLEALVDALNMRSASSDFAFIETGVIHTDVIKAGLIYNSSIVVPVGRFALLNSDADSRFNDDRNRPGLAQAFDVRSTGARFNVVVNHLKSKGSSCEADGDPDLGDGQGNCNLARTNAAAALADWVRSDPTGSNDDDYLVIGDMNAYYLEDPIETMRAGGLVDLLAKVENPYSFVFDAQSGAFDYALASATLAAQVVETIEWHINVDEPPLLDYNLEFGRDPALFDGTTPYRSSDHDPILVGLELKN
jgi:predicted extracellular nuclease